MAIDFSKIYKAQPLPTAFPPTAYASPRGGGQYPQVGLPDTGATTPVGGTSSAYDWEEPWDRPSWMPGGAYSVNQWPELGLDPSWVNQTWLRSPQWGGHVIWNPTYGWQDYPTVANMYKEAGGPVSWADFQNWGLTPQTDQNWASYFPGRTGDGTQSKTGASGYGANIYENFPYPGEWDLASMIYSMFGLGLPTQIPEQWDWASDYAKQFAETGMPTDVSQWRESEQPLLEQRISDQTKQMYEQAGLTGMEWSSPLGRSIAEMTGRETSSLWADLAEKQLGLTEAAKSRQMGALPMLYGIGQGITGLAESAKNRGLSAAGGLTGLGQAKTVLPQQVAQGLYSTGIGQTGLSQEMINQQLQEFMRNAPENNPWLQMALMLAGGMQGGYAPQMYNPSIWTQLLNSSSSILPWLWMMNQNNPNQNQPTGSAAGYP
jgi:hypothetical protein